ncbi:MAG: LptA/OstA family protein, partial [Acidobacteriota bacterium]
AINAVADKDLVHAVLDGPPKRDIVAKTVRVGMANKVVTDLKAEWQVVMKELGDVPRELTGDHVLVSFDPATHRASSSSVEGNFHYKDPRNTAAAIRATYDITGDRLLLTAEPGFDPTVTTDGNVLKAKEIEFSPRAGTARATGEVIAQLVSKQNGGPTADTTSIFPAGKPVFINSQSLLMRQGEKVAVFSGNVRAWQDGNTLFAQELQVQGAGEQISARGAVRTVLYNTSPSATASKSPMLSSSDQLFARKADRRIDLVGNVKIDDEQRNMTSEKASFFFDNSRKIERVESETKLVLVDRATSRKGTGDKATYLVAKRMIYVIGSPATMTAPTGHLSGEQIAFDLARNKVEVLSPTSEIKGNYKP